MESKKVKSVVAPAPAAPKEVNKDKQYWIKQLGKLSKSALADKEGISRPWLDSILDKFEITKDDYTPPPRQKRTGTLTEDEKKAKKRKNRNKSYQRLKEKGLNHCLYCLTEEQKDWFTNEADSTGLKNTDLFENMKKAYKLIKKK